nr:carboxypeptidase regulatory-like domain-containing protein [Ignavibacteria bacterium]
MNLFFTSIINLKSRIFSIWILLFFLFTNSIFADAKTGHLTGQIVDKESNSIISYAKIVIENEESGKILQSYSDNSGKYRFDKVISGNYKIKVSSIGYKEFAGNIEIVQDSTTIVNVFMEQSAIETDRINVTSTKTEVTLQQTPSSISIVTAEEIANKNILTFDNILEEVQGVTINRSNGRNVSSLSIRGSSDVAGGGI